MKRKTLKYFHKENVNKREFTNLHRDSSVLANKKSSHKNFSVISFYFVCISWIVCTWALCRLFSSITDFCQSWQYIWVIRRVSDKKQELLNLREHLRFTTRFWWGSCCPSCFLFCLSSSWVLCDECCQCLSNVHSWFPIRFSGPAGSMS